MRTLRERRIGAEILRSYHSISENLGQVVPLVLTHMRRQGLSRAYAADIIKALGDQWAKTKSGQHTMLNACIGEGVELGGYVLQIETLPTSKLYEKSKVVTLTPGALESFVAPPPPRDAPDPPRAGVAPPLLNAGVRPLVHSAPPPASEDLRALIASGDARLAAGLTYLEQKFDAAVAELTARIAKLEGADL